MLDIPCVIFAGGKSSRMGEDKALLPFDSSPTLTQYQLTRLQKIFNNVHISCKDSSKFSFSANFIEDIRQEETYAPTVAFTSVFKQLNSDSIFVIAVDTPFVSEQEIAKIVQSNSLEYDATVASTETTIHPMCGVYNRSIESSFAQMLENNTHKLNFLLKQSNTKYIEFKNEDPFMNVNTKEEYKRALELI